LKQAKQQIEAAKGARIEWHFAEEEAAKAVKALFKQEDVKGIEVYHTPSNSQ
jgi:hypothetical protein